MTLETFFKAIIDFITDIIAAIYRFMGKGVTPEELNSTTAASAPATAAE